MMIRPQVVPRQEYDITAPLRPQSGIDKIKLLLNGNYVTPVFQEAIQKNNPYTLFPADNSICLEKRGSYYLLILNQEYFDFEQNILAQINNAIILLVNSSLLIATEQLSTGNALPYISHISEVEFYFDNEPKHLWILSNKSCNRIDQAKEQDLLFRYTDNNNTLTNTYYSNDYIPGTDTRSAVPSRVAIYDKQQRDLATRIDRKGITKEMYEARVFNHPWKTRLEFRLSREYHGKYLGLMNFQGTYSQILGRYKELLAVIYNHYCEGKIMYDNNSNKDLQRIIRKLPDVITYSRFTNRDGKLIED